MSWLSVEIPKAQTLDRLNFLAFVIREDLESEFRTVEDVDGLRRLWAKRKKELTDGK